MFIFEFLTIFLIFILAANLKILKSKSTTLSEDLFLCQVSKGSAVRFEFKKNSTLVTMATAAILNLLNSQKLPHTTVNIPTKFHKVRWKESKKNFWLISFHYMWMLFLASVINFCLESNLLWSFLCFSIFLAFWPFHGNGDHFENSKSAHLLIVLNIPVKFH
jgi:hypothetical protein